MPDVTRVPDLARLLLATAAVITGCALLVALGAPSRMPLMNFAALLIGLAGLALFGVLRRASVPGAVGDWALVLLATVVPATALFGEAAGTVARWIVIAGVTVQPAIIAVPVIAIALASRPSPVRAAAAAVAAVGVALQPDPAAATMLLAGTAAPLVLARRDLPLALACASAAAAFALAWLVTPALPPVPFVEAIAAQAFAGGPAATALLLLGAALALAPAAVSAARNSRSPAASFAALWAAAMAASLVGSYPTPILGFGGSAILGYILSAG
ncbi:MAG: hypothetical protein H0W39_06345, partial [Sphingomonas sp.]|nr:hypothetical protein [Sphingomonas sp.]